MATKSNKSKSASLKAKKSNDSGKVEMINPYIKKDGTPSAAFAVVGDTKPLANKLKELHGKFNPFLVKGSETVKGWIFSPKYLDDVKKALNMA